MSWQKKNLLYLQYIFKKWTPKKKQHFLTHTKPKSKQQTQAPRAIPKVKDQLEGLVLCNLNGFMGIPLRAILFGLPKKKTFKHRNYSQTKDLVHWCTVNKKFLVFDSDSKPDLMPL